MVRVDLGEVDYLEAAEAMRGWVKERQAGQAPDRLFLLTHPPVITYGRHTAQSDLPQDGSMPVIEVDRGGHATYHGPGQLVGYLVINIRERAAGDVVRWLELALIEALTDLGFPAVRRDTPPGADSLVGVWTPDHHKLVSIGMRIREGVTSHGFAINVDSDLDVYDRFVACRLDGVTMTSLRHLADTANRPMPTMSEVRAAVARSLGATRPVT
ncbi:lipoyl(octanoyl) transferase LipB [Dactylosporangium sp. NPDC051541]|uniref:lipoyl(octanoyl) transferase LipB n=1 Tax=Dactylosporangium sp. NPDC051541 TaxID=3363977 RepID=UPI003792E605